MTTIYESLNKKGVDMNFIIIILAAAVAYILTELYGIAEGLHAEYQLRQEQKKRFKDDLYRFKLKQLYLFMTAYYIECGYSKQHAKIKAVNYVMELERNDYITEKYECLRGFYGGRSRNKSRCR